MDRGRRRRARRGCRRDVGLEPHRQRRVAARRRRDRQRLRRLRRIRRVARRRLPRSRACRLPRFRASATCLASRDPHVRHVVVEALGRLSHPTASAYVRVGARRRRSARAAAGGRSARPAGLAAATTRSFAEMARSDPSEGVRRTARRRAAARRRSRPRRARRRTMIDVSAEYAGRSGDRPAGAARARARAHRHVLRRQPRVEMLAERLAPLVVARGFRSFLDLYYLLKYRRPSATAAWRGVFDALAVPETYFWREIDQIRGDRRAASCPSSSRRARGRAADLERAVRERRGAADDRDGARTRPAGSIAPTSRFMEATRVPAAIARAREGRYRARSLRALPPAARGQVLHGGGGAVRARARADAANHVVERREPDGNR